MSRTSAMFSVPSLATPVSVIDLMISRFMSAAALAPSMISLVEIRPCSPSSPTIRSTRRSSPVPVVLSTR